MKLLSTLYIAILAITVASAQVCPGTPGQITYEIWQQLYDDEHGELSAEYNYPSMPDITLTRYRLQTSINFDNMMGSRLRGFITVPESTTATFNLTGDRLGRFYLSTDDSPEQMQLIAEHTGNTSIAEHDKYESQTSEVISLQAGEYYYFELVHIDGTGGDHATVYWQTDLVDPNLWTIVSFDYLVDVDCLDEPCPARGTMCDDGDPATADDIEDGFCNCAGTPTTSNTCIGERSKLTSFRYEDITGGGLSNLYEAPNYPAMPDYSSDLSELGVGTAGEINNIGHLVQGYLAVPVSGDYIFNLTGDDQTKFFLSSDEDPANKMEYELTVTGWTRATQHDRYPTQTGPAVTLQAGSYYYFEINHKEGAGSEAYAVFWKSPYAESDAWKRIPDTYLYGYECTLACIPEGTSCDDGNPYTKDDQYDSNCTCVGTPCTAPDCDDPLVNYIPYDDCSLTDQLDNRPESQWLSCEFSGSPNLSRPDAHWIMYDLSERHFLFQSQIWNYNVAGETDKGFQSVAVDYSMDRTTWTTLGTFSWPEATGEGSYSGFAGPDFMGVEARYILITSLDLSTPCQGLGKAAFTAVKCPYEGTFCDDNNLNTYDDRYNDNCECVGTDYFANECEELNLVLGDSILTTEKYSAVETVTSISEVDASVKVSIIGGDYIELNPGFETEAEATFLASIDTCETTAGRQAQPLSSLVAERRQEVEQAKMAVFQLLESNSTDQVTVRYYLENPSHGKLQLLDANGRSVYTLADHQYTNGGVFEKRFRTKKLAPGMYTARLITDFGIFDERLLVE